MDRARPRWTRTAPLLACVDTHDRPRLLSHPALLQNGLSAMKCFDCDSEGRVADAVAVCNSCGAAVCSAHATSSPRSVERPNGLGVRTLPRSARQMHCPTCTTARTVG